MKSMIQMNFCKLLVLVILITGCAHIQLNNCWSECGVRLIGSDECTSYKKAETQITRALELKTGKDVCTDMVGWIIHVQPTGGNPWRNKFGEKVAGTTDCTTMTIRLATDDWPRSSLVHEFIHAGVECPRYNNSHADWDKPGWKKEFVDNFW